MNTWDKTQELISQQKGKIEFRNKQIVQKDKKVQQIFGISKDESIRMRVSQYHYIDFEYPLIDKINLERTGYSVFFAGDSLVNRNLNYTDFDDRQSTIMDTSYYSDPLMESYLLAKSKITRTLNILLATVFSVLYNISPKKRED